MGTPAGSSILEEISTRWPLISDPVQFMLRYAPAVQRYLKALIKDPHDAEDVAQNCLLRLVYRPLTPDRVRHGQFRHYLKALLRNEAITFYRYRRRHPAGPATDLEAIPAPEVENAADCAWLAEWQDCLLSRTWEALEQHERQAPEGAAYTVLRLATDHPEEDSVRLAQRAALQLGRAFRPEAFRKQLSRARRRFAQLLVSEVQKTLEQPRLSDVVEELNDLGLMAYARDFLPEPFRKLI